MANRATSEIASLVTTKSASFSANRYRYCFSNAFFGSVSTCLSSPSVNRFVVVMIGNRPTNSGIRPYLTKSDGSARDMTSSKAWSAL